MITKPSTLTFRTKTGLEVFIRPLSPEDAPYLTDVFAHMGSESRYLRFNQALSDPDPELIQEGAQQLARVSLEEGAAWLAFADLPGQPHAPLGGMRFIRAAPGVAEASVAVRDDMQRQGIGSTLLEFLVQEARKAGIHTLTAVVLHANRGIWQLLKKSGLSYQRHSSGSVVELSIDLAVEPAAVC